MAGGPHPDKIYLELLDHVLNYGATKPDRTGIGTLSVFGRTFHLDTLHTFPLLTTKFVSLKNVATELKWFLKGDTNIRYLLDNDCNIWNDDAYNRYCRVWNYDLDKPLSKEDYIKKVKTDDEFAKIWGDLGPIYGHQWRNWNGTDQLAKLMDTLKEDPNSRRMIVNSWNVDDLGVMGLPPCHFSFQIYHERGRVDLMWNQRSADLFLGLPYNIASYALLLRLIAHETNMLPGYIIGALGDVHLYQNHLGAAYKQLQLHAYEAPKLKIISSDILNGEFEYELLGYEHNPSIKAKLNT